MSSAEPEIDTTTPSIARCYDALLGGTNHFPVDQAVLDQLVAVAPELAALAWENRGFLSRATRFLAGKAGIDQFLDCGSGLPTVENTHQVAQRINPRATVVYVDNDPLATAHGRRLLSDNDYAAVVQADFRDPEALFANANVRQRIDLERPLALYHIGTLHHLSDDERPGELAARYLDALPSGSYVVFSHFYRPDEPSLAAFAERLEGAFLSSAMGSGRFRRAAELTEYLPGLEPVEPGWVPLADWWPDGPDLTPREPVRNLMLGVVGRVP